MFRTNWTLPMRLFRLKKYGILNDSLALFPFGRKYHDPLLYTGREICFGDC